MDRLRDNLRTVVFGIEDSLVSTTGVITGLIAAGTSKSTLLAAGLITIVVESTSMGAGEFISNDDSKAKDKDALLKGCLMLAAYFITGLWVMVPLFIGITNNVIIISFTFVSLFVLGWWRGKVLNGNRLKYAVKTVLISGIACAFGIAVGLTFR